MDIIERQHGTAYTPSMTSITPASDHVTSTFELVENILRYVPTRNLAQCQRVCRVWKDVIAGSRSLQQQLFLRPLEEGMALLYELRKPRKEPELKTSSIVSLHPIFRTTMISKNYHFTHFCFDFPARYLLKWPSPSPWDDMLLTQPPCFELQLHMKEGYTNSQQTIRHDGGVQLGLLRDCIRELVGRGTDRADRLAKRVFVRVNECVLETSPSVQGGRGSGGRASEVGQAGGYDQAAPDR